MISLVFFLCMPKIKGQPKEMIAYRCPPNLLKKIDESIKNGDFSTRPEAITAALHAFYENRDTETVVMDLFEKGKFDVVMKEAAEGVVIELLEEKRKQKR